MRSPMCMEQQNYKTFQNSDGCADFRESAGGSDEELVKPLLYSLLWGFRAIVNAGKQVRFDMACVKYFTVVSRVRNQN